MYGVVKYSKSDTFIDTGKENDANIDAYVEECFVTEKNEIDGNNCYQMSLRE